MQLFHHANRGGFLLLPIDNRKSETSSLPSTPRASPAITKNQEIATHSINKKQEKVTKQILIGSRARGRKWKVKGGYFNISCLKKGKWIIKRIEWLEDFKDLSKSKDDVEA